MSLKVTNTRIVIENSSGQEMFDSDQKLIHRKFTQTSSSAVSLGNGYNSTVTYSLNTTLGEKDFALVFVTPTNGDGNVLDDVLNSTVQLNFPMMANFRHSTTDTRITHYEVWSSAIYWQCTVQPDTEAHILVTSGTTWELTLLVQEGECFQNQRQTHT